MTLIASTPSQVQGYQTLVVRKGLQACKKGYRLNTAYTPTNLRKMTEHITGKKFKARDYDGMIAALNATLPEGV